MFPVPERRLISFWVYHKGLAHIPEHDLRWPYSLKVPNHGPKLWHEKIREEKGAMRHKTRDFFDLSCRILGSANKETPRITFLEEMLKTLLAFSGCDLIEMWIDDGRRYRGSRSDKDGKTGFHFKVNGAPRAKREREWIGFLLGNGEGFSDEVSGFRTRDGGLWINDLDKALSNCSDDERHFLRSVDAANKAYRSIGLIPFRRDGGKANLLQLKKMTPDHFKRTDADHYESISRMIGIALMNWQIHAALNERIKELTCLYNLMQLSDQPELKLNEILKGAVELLPPAWQYPEVASARIVFDDEVFALPGFENSKHKQSADILVKGKPRGIVEVGYTEVMLELDEGPFLKEERKLIENIARELSLVIERHLYEEEEARLYAQLRHADRLSIIGQLSAAVAHELNEPLANILGFAQLALKSEDLTKQVRADIEKIQGASLHSREIIRKLLAFSRPIPLKKSQVNLNRVIEETLYFFDSRCTKEGIVLERSLSRGIPDIHANSGQLMQVVTNLVVNAMHAMPGGGKLNVGTRRSGEGHVSLIVADTGSGMSEEVKTKIFTPFFTNKGVGQGTGLGLPVVHGIVLAHGGTILVDSQPGRGTTFEIKFPVIQSPIADRPGKEPSRD